MIMKVLWYDYEGVSLMHTPSSKVTTDLIDFGCIMRVINERTAAEIDIGTVSSIFPQSGDDTGTEDLVLSLRVRADGWNGIFSVRFGACVLYKLMEHII